jgi:hypothetical protein
MSSPEAPNDAPKEIIDTYHMPPGRVWEILSSDAFRRAFEDPRTEQGAMEAFMRVEREMAERGEYIDDSPY